MKGSDVCEECGGTGEIESRYRDRTYRCPTCDGTGYLDVPSDRQRLAHLEGVD